VTNHHPAQPKTRGPECLLQIIDRKPLGEWLTEALDEGSQEGSWPVKVGFAGWARSRSAEAKAAATIVAAACLVMLFVIIQVAVRAHPAAASSRPRTGVSAAPSKKSVKGRIDTGTGPTAPRAVAVAYFEAISRHDWLEVWKLGGKNLGQGLYTTYAGMVAGYQGTVKDVPVALHAKGQAVSGQFLAYESNGEVRTYAFTYLVRDGVIIRAAQREVHSTWRRT